MRVPRATTAGGHRSGRPRRGWSAFVLGVAGALVGILVGAGPAVAAGTDSLTLNPDSGRPTALFTAEYRFFPATLACPAVQFTWDGRALKKVTPQQRRAKTDPCVARLVAIPPVSDRTPGPHLVGAGTLSAAYTIVLDPTSSARPIPTPSRTSATGQPTDNVVAGGVDTSQTPLAPLAAGAPSVAGASGGSGGGGLMSWILIFGGLLVLGGIGIFGLLVYWTRRGGPAEDDADTQVIG